MVWLPNLWNLIARRVSRAQDRGDYDRAVRWAERYARWFPSHEVAWLGWGRLLAHLKEVEGAKRVLRMALAKHQSSLELRGLLAYLLLDVEGARDKVGDEALDESLELLQRNVEMDPDSPEAYWLLAWRSQRMEAWDEARHYASMCEARFDVRDDPDIARYLGGVLLFVPEERRRGLNLIEGAALHGDGKASLLMSVVLERENPERSQIYLGAARQHWSGNDAEWRSEVEHYREYYGPVSGGSD